MSFKQTWVGIGYIIALIVVLGVDTMCFRMGMEAMNQPYDFAVLIGIAIALIPLYATVALIAMLVSRYRNSKINKDELV